MRRVWWAGIVVGVTLALTGVVPGRYIVALFMGLAIWRVGIASFGSLRLAAAHVSDRPPLAVDQGERVTYRCSSCGAEVLLLARGTLSPPRHCGESMVERRELARGSLN
jgi:hypothetical protein